MKHIIRFTLAVLLAVCSGISAAAWDLKSNEKVTDDISGYYYLQSNSGSAYFTARTKVENDFLQSTLLPATCTLTAAYLGTTTDATFDASMPASKYIFQLKRQSDGNYTLRYCGSPRPVYFHSTGVGNNNFEVVASGAETAASHFAINKITDASVGNFMYYFHDDTYGDDATMPIRYASSGNPVMRVYATAASRGDAWEPGCRISMTKLDNSQIPAEALEANMNFDRTLEDGTYRINTLGSATNSTYGGCWSWVAGPDANASSSHISTNLMEVLPFVANDNNFLFDLKGKGDGTYSIYNKETAAYLKSEMTDNTWGYVTTDAENATGHSISTIWNGNAYEVLSANNLCHYREGGTNFLCTNNAESWANWSFELQKTVPADGYTQLFSTNSFNIPDGLKAYIVSRISSGKIVLSEVSATIPANTPVVLQGSAGTYYLPVSISNTKRADNLLHGYTDGTVSSKVFKLNGTTFTEREGSSLVKGDIYLLASDFEAGALTSGMEFTLEPDKGIGGTFAVLGNSISTFEGSQPTGYAVYYTSASGRLESIDDTWWMQTGKMSGLNYLANASWSGSCVSNGDGGASTESYFYTDGRIAAIGRNGTPEYLFIAGGVNDWWRGGGVCALGEYGSTDPSTFCGAYNLMLQKIKAKYPYMKIVCLSIFPNRRTLTEVNTKGWTMGEGNESIKQLAEDNGCYFIDMNSCDIKNHIAEMTIDGLHPDKAGAKLVAQTVAKGLVSLGLATSTGFENFKWAETNDYYYYLKTYNGGGNYTYVYPKAYAGGETSVPTGTTNLQYYGTIDGNQVLSESEKTNSSLIFHVYSRGGNKQFFIKDIGNAGATYLKMCSEADAWDVVSFTNTPNNTWSTFKIYEGPTYGRHMIKSVGNSTYYWRHGGTENGITTSTSNQYGDGNLGNEFEFERIDAALVPWAKYVEEVNTNLGLIAGEELGYIQTSKYDAFHNMLSACDLTYDAVKDYATLLSEVQAAKEAALVKIDGFYTLGFNSSLKNKWAPNASGVLTYTTYDESNSNFFYDIRKQNDGNYIIKNVGNTSAPYIKNSNIGNYVRSTQISFQSTLGMENELRFLCLGLYRVYAAGDFFGYNLGVSQVTTYNSNVSADIVKILPTPKLIKEIDSYGYATLCSKKAWIVPSSGITVYIVSSVDKTAGVANLTALSAGTVVPAGTGILIKGTAGYHIMEYSAVDGIALTNNKLIGVTEDSEVGANTVMALGKVGGVTGFYKQSSSTIAAGMAYLSNTDASIQKFVLKIADPSAISTISANKMQQEKVYYNLKGQRVSNPSRGIVILNNKKVFIK